MLVHGHDPVAMISQRPAWSLLSVPNMAFSPMMQPFCGELPAVVNSMDYHVCTYEDDDDVGDDVDGH